MIAINMFCSGHWLTRTLSIPREKDYPLVESDEETEYVLLRSSVLGTSAVYLCLPEQSAALGCAETLPVLGKCLLSGAGGRVYTIAGGAVGAVALSADLAEDGMVEECSSYKATQAQRLERWVGSILQYSHCS